MDLCSWIKKDDTYFGNMSCLTLIFLPIFSLSHTLHECLINIANAKIYPCNQSSFISTWLVHLQYFLIPVSYSSFITSRSVLLIAQLYLSARLTRLNTRVTSAGAVGFAMSFDSISLF